MKDKKLEVILKNINSPISKEFLKLNNIALSSEDWCICVEKNKKFINTKTKLFIIKEYPNTFTKNEIIFFCKKLNELSKEMDESVPLEYEFKGFNPLNPRETFLSMVTETYPAGHEEEVLKFLPNDLMKDKWGNYFKVIGDSNVMFTSHLDTACKEKSKVNLRHFFIKNQEIIKTDGTSILGADDKAGVTIMLYLMAKNVPGIYYFFLAEEIGGIGSGKVAKAFYENTLLSKIKKVVSFDRRGYYSIITHQLGERCCSDLFAETLCNELSDLGLKMKLDETGIFTDSANFMNNISECVNISVGYFNEHTKKEIQNITYLDTLCRVLSKVNWENLPNSRKQTYSDEILDKYLNKINIINNSIFANNYRFTLDENNNLFFVLKTNTDKPYTMYNDLFSIKRIIGNNEVITENDFFKIKL